MDQKHNETPLLTKIFRRFKAQCNKNKRCMKDTPSEDTTEGQNKIERDDHASSPCGCHCVASCYKSLGSNGSSDWNDPVNHVHPRLHLSKSCVDCQLSSQTKICPNTLMMPEGYSSLCDLFDQIHRCCLSTHTLTKPSKRDSEIQTDPLPNLPPLCSKEQIIHMNSNISPVQTPNPFNSDMADKQSPTRTDVPHLESFDQTSSSGYSTCSFDQKTSASRTQSDPSLQEEPPLSPRMESFRFDYRLRTSSCMLVSPDGSDSSQPNEYQQTTASQDRKHWDQQPFPITSTSRPSRTQSQSTPTHELNHDDFVPSDHRRRSLSDSYAFEAFRGAKRIEKLRKMKRNGTRAKYGGLSLGLTFREEKIKNINISEEKLSRKTAFSSFLDKMPKLSLLKRFKEKPLQYESVPDLSKYEPKTLRKLKGSCRNVRSHEQLDQAGIRNLRACSVSSSNTLRFSPDHSDCGYIDPDIVSRNFSKNNALNRTKSVRRTMSINATDTKVRNITSFSADTTPFHRNGSPALRSCNLSDVGAHQDNDEFYMTFDPDLNPPCHLPVTTMHSQPLSRSTTSTVSYGTLPKNWRQMNWPEQNGKESWYERLGDPSEDNPGKTTTPKTRPSTISPRHLWKQRSDNRKYMPLPPLPTEHTKQDIYQEIPADNVFTLTKTTSLPCTPTPSYSPPPLEYTSSYPLEYNAYPYPLCEDMHHGVCPPSKSRFGPFTHSSSSLPGNLTSPCRSPGRGNVCFSEGFLAKKLPVVSENGMRRRPDFISVNSSDLPEDCVSTEEGGTWSPPLHMTHRRLKHTLSVPNRHFRHPKYQGYQSSTPVEEKKSDVREEVCRGKVKIPPIFLQQ